MIMSYEVVDVPAGSISARPGLYTIGSVTAVRIILVITANGNVRSSLRDWNRVQKIISSQGFVELLFYTSKKQKLIFNDGKTISAKIIREMKSFLCID